MATQTTTPAKETMVKAIHSFAALTATVDQTTQLTEEIAECAMDTLERLSALFVAISDRSDDTTKELAEIGRYLADDMNNHIDCLWEKPKQREEQ